MIVVSKKKSIVFSIIIVLLIISLVSAFTYAFFVGRTDEKDFGADSGELSVSYDISENITGETLSPSSSRDDGLRSVAVAKLNVDSVNALFNLYITPTTIDNELAISALKWEVDIVDKDGNVVKNISDDFDDANVNEPIKIIDGYALTTDNTTFNIYIWLDSSLIVEPIVDKRFVAKISADSVDITGTF